ATRDERIVLARTIIERALEQEDAALTGEHESDPVSYPGCWCFTAQAGSFLAGVRVNGLIAQALVDAGFGSDDEPAVTYGSPIGGPGVPHVGLYYHVPVGAS